MSLVTKTIQLLKNPQVKQWCWFLVFYGLSLLVMGCFMGLSRLFIKLIAF